MALRIADPHEARVVQKQSLGEELGQIEQEARMVLPGIQGLFGFQLVAAFNQSFKTLLSQAQQNLHFAALLCTVLAILFVMSPAAYHRQAEPGEVSPRMAKLGTRFLTAAMVPLMIGIDLDVYVVGVAITGSGEVARWSAVIVAALLAMAWFGFPWMVRARRQARQQV